MAEQEAMAPHEPEGCEVVAVFYACGKCGQPVTTDDGEWFTHEDPSLEPAAEPEP